MDPVTGWSNNQPQIAAPDNGKIASEVIDDEKAKRLDKGFIGFQLHSGDKMVIAFKDISVKR